MKRLLLPSLLACSLGTAALSQETQAERDVGFIQGLIEDNLSDVTRVVRIEGFEGALSSNATIEELTIADEDGVWFRATGLVLSWNRSAILSGEIDVEEMSAETIEFLRPPVSDPAPPSAEATPFEFSLPDLPVGIFIDQIVADRIVLGAPLLGEEYAFSINGTVSLSGGEGQAVITASRLDGPQGQFEISGAYSNETEILALTMDLTEAEDGLVATALDIPDRPSVRLVLDGTAPITDYDARLSIATDGVERIEGQFGLVSTPTSDGTAREMVLDIEGDVNALIATNYSDLLGDNVALAVQGARSPEGELTLSQLDLTARTIALSGQAEIDADGWPRRLDLTGQIRDLDGSAVTLPGDGVTTTVQSADLAITFDAEDGDGWTADVTVQDFIRPDVSVPALTLLGGGIIRRGEGSGLGRVTGALRYGASGIAFTDEGLAQALGDTLTGDFAFDSVTGAPFEITSLSMRGPGVEIDATATIALDDGLSIDSEIALVAEDMARFSRLTGLQLAGSSDLTLTGQVQPLDGMFSLQIAGGTEDLSFGIGELDPLLAGIGTITATATRDTTGTRLDALRIATPEAEITADAVLTSEASRATFDMDIRDLAISVPELPGPARLSGEAAIAPSGALDIKVIADLPGTRADITASAPTLEGSAPITLDLTASIDSLAPYSDLIGQRIGGGIDMTASGTLAADLSAADIVVMGETQDLSAGIAQLDPYLDGTGTLQVRIVQDSLGLLLDDLMVDTDLLSLEGVARASQDGRAATFALSLASLTSVLPDLAGAASLAGTVQQTSTGAITADLALRAPGQVRADVRAQLTGLSATDGVTATIQLDAPTLQPYADLIGQSLRGAVSGSVQIETDLSLTEIASTLDLAARDIGFGTLDLAGQLTLKGQIDGTPASQSGQADLEITGPGSAAITLVGTLSDGSADGRVRATIEDLRPYSALAGRALTGQLNLVAAGTAALDASVFDLSFSTQGTDLSAAGVGLTGGIDASGTAQRDDTGQVNIALNADGPGGTQVAAAISGQDMLTLDLTARVDNLSTYAGLIGQPVSGGADITITGQAAQDLSRFDIDLRGTTRNLNPGVQAAAPVLRGIGTIEAGIEQQTGGALTINGLRVDYPNLDAQADLQITDAGTRGSFSARLADVGLFTDALSGPATASGTAELSASGRTTLDVTATGPGGLTADISGDIGANADLDLRIDAQAPLPLANSFIAPRSLTGTATIDLAVRGQPSLDAVSGTVAFNDARLAAPTLGRALEGIDGTLALNAGQATLSLSGAPSDGGRVTIDGPVQLSAPFNADLSVSIVNVVIRDPALYETTANGQLSVSGPLTGAGQIRGTIALGRTEIQVPSSSVSALGTLPVVRHIGADGAVRTTLDRAGLTTDGSEAAQASGPSGPGLGLDIAIEAPQQIFVRGRGLDAELGGTLNITGTTNQIIPIGAFELIRGRIDILQQRFDLDEGTAFLQGDFVPTLRLVASTEARDGTIVEIIVNGPATDPNVTFQSSPDLPQDEVLARLLFGRDLSDITPLQAVQLAAAVSTLAGNSSGGLIDDFRTGLGLDDLDIVTDEDGNAAVRAGAYISDNVYTDVTVGSENTEINLNLDVTDDVTITGSTNTEGGTSIGIFFERDY